MLKQVVHLVLHQNMVQCALVFLNPLKSQNNFKVHCLNFIHLVLTYIHIVLPFLFSRFSSIESRCRDMIVFLLLICHNNNNIYIYIYLILHMKDVFALFDDIFQ